MSNTCLSIPGNVDSSARKNGAFIYHRHTSSTGSVHSVQSIDLKDSRESVCDPEVQRGASLPQYNTQLRYANRVRVFFIVVVMIVSVFPLAMHVMRVVNNSRQSCGWNNEGAWVAGVAFGSTPYDLQYGTNAAVTCANVKDAPVGFVSDTFILPSSTTYSKSSVDKWLMFFEVLNYNSGHGDIGMAWSPDQGGHWVYEAIVVNESFHLSYPFVLKHELNTNTSGGLVMIPESSAINEVRAYTSNIDKPTEWTFKKTLIRGKAYMDSSVIEYEGTWYMWAWVEDTNSLHLFHSKSLLDHEWIEHPMSPFDSSTVHRDFRRPGGRPLVHEGKLIRYAREGAQRMLGCGSAVWALNVDILNTTHYHERAVKRISPVGGEGWVSKRVGSVDAHEIAPGVWVAGISGDHLHDYPVARYFASMILLLVGLGVLVVFSILITPITKRVNATRRYVHKFAMEHVYTHPIIMVFSGLCVALIVLWQYDFLLDCRPPLNVVNFTGVGVLCKSMTTNPVKSCAGYLDLVQTNAHIEHTISTSTNVIARPVKKTASNASELAQCDVTLVTALFDLTKFTHENKNIEEKFKSRSFDKYQNWFVNILKLNACLVIYIEPESEFIVWEHRNASNTVVHVVPDILSGYAMLDNIQSVLDNTSYIESVSRPGRPEMKMAAYDVTMFKKVDYVQETVLANSFRSEFFFWVDGGYGHGRRMPDYGGESWPDPIKVRKYVSPFQVFILQADEPDAQDCQDLRSKFKNHKTTMAGGFFGGKAQPLLDFHASFHRQLETTLSMGILDDDQAIFFASWCEQHSLFQMEQCPPNLMCQVTGTKRCFDRWNCAVSFFAPGDIHGHHITLDKWIEV